ncbi:MAG TPA: DUF1549 domain-containing protein, partial [Planctomycetia bacterium]|nr:DUF1549 domain-containing protein [Planctomycetia bacterium]
MLEVAVALWAGLAFGQKPPAPDFMRDVRPILARNCFSCHGPDKQKNGFRLDRKKSAMAGGDGGPAIVPGDAANSPLIRYVAGEEPGLEMPPGEKRLEPKEIAVLRAWIDAGAAWPDDGSGKTETWWSLRPLRKPAAPGVPAELESRVRTPVDRFLFAKLREKGLAPSPEADRRTLIRRLYFDLVGLPPSPEEVDGFAADKDPAAYEKLVDRLLASPNYGERWARHWLDVVHYGDTHGYDKDQPRPNAWPYRDYVVRAFNADKPYGRFVTEQLAGDVVAPGESDGVEALGFIAAGPWDLIGHAEVPETKIDGQIARHLDRDDMVANTANTFLSLTVQCAQCHNHKFDPITQEEYYRLQSVFAALDRADKPYYRDRDARRRAAELDRIAADLKSGIAKAEAEIRHAAGPEWDRVARTLAAKPGPKKRPAEYGYHSAIEKDPNAVKWVQVDLGSPHTLDRVEMYACDDDFAGIGAGFGFPIRCRVEASADPSFASPMPLADRSKEDHLNPGLRTLVIPAAGVKAQYVRVTATRLAPRTGDNIFALAELRVLDSEGKNVAAGKKVTALDSIEAGPRWAKANLVDGKFPVDPAGSPERVAAEEAREKLLSALVDLKLRERWRRLNIELEATQAAESRQPPDLVYAGT